MCRSKVLRPPATDLSHSVYPTNAPPAAASAPGTDRLTGRESRQHPPKVETATEHPQHPAT